MTTTTTGISKRVIEAAQTYIERENVIRAILDKARGRSLDSAGQFYAGRYQFLWQELQKAPDTRQLLLETKGDAFAANWREFIAERLGKGPFLHGLTLLYWEWAETLEAADKALSAAHYRQAACLWEFLLGHPTYWTAFCKDHERETYAGGLHQAIRQQVLRHHLDRIKEAVAQNNPEWATLHLHCFYPWGRNEHGKHPGFVAPRRKAPRWDDDALALVNGEAERLFNEWVSDWLRSAGNQLNDPDAKLPRGIGKNYQPALDGLEKYTRLAEANPALFKRLLSFVVEHTNQWTMELISADNETEAQRLTQHTAGNVKALAAALKPPAPGTLALKEHEVLSFAYLFQAKFLDKPDARIKAADEARRWNPNAPNLSVQVKVKSLLDTAQQHLEAGRFAEADSELDKVAKVKSEDLNEQSQIDQAVNNLRGGVHFRWATHEVELANQASERLERELKGLPANPGELRLQYADPAMRKAHERPILNVIDMVNLEKSPSMKEVLDHLRAAHTHMLAALKTDPNHPVLKENARFLEQEVKDRPHDLRLKVGKFHLEKRNFGDAIAALSTIPGSYARHDVAIAMLAGAHFQHAVELANDGQFSAALESMRQAEHLQPDEPMIASQRREIERALEANRYNGQLKQAQQAIEREDFDEALYTLDNLPDDLTPAVTLRAAAYFRRAVTRANNGDLESAYQDMREAARLQPRDRTIAAQLAEIERLRQGAGHVREFNRAQELMGQERWQDALNILERIPGHIDAVSQAMAICEFRIGVNCAQSNRLTEALQHLERAARHDPNQPVIRQQLDALRNANRGGGLAKTQKKNADYQRAGQIAEAVVTMLQNAEKTKTPLTYEQGSALLGMLEEAVKLSDNDSQIVALRNQMRSALGK